MLTCCNVNLYTNHSQSLTSMFLVLSLITNISSSPLRSNISASPAEAHLPAGPNENPRNEILCIEIPQNDTSKAKRIHYTPELKLQLVCLCTNNAERYLKPGSETPFGSLPLHSLSALQATKYPMYAKKCR